MRICQIRKGVISQLLTGSFQQNFKYPELPFCKENCIIVGDHPMNDIIPARILGIKAYRITTGRFTSLDNDSRFPPNKTFLTLDDFFQEIIKNEN